MNTEGTVSKIKPALTADEWAALLGGGGTGHLHIADDGRLEVWGELGLDSPKRHATAAACLHGQPFGFTREMLVALRDALACSGTVLSPDNLPLAEQAVDRIEALLPPEAKP